MRGLMLLLVAVTCAHAQWIIQSSHTTASLRGIHNTGGGVVWASGTQGTILHTIDDGRTWQTCPIPPGAQKLDFRGIQAFDANIAIVMSSGTGNLSRLYKTVDACRTWRLVFTNPDENGFWDGLRFRGPGFGLLIGDQVNGHFPVFFSTNAGETWQRMAPATLPAAGKNQSFFAASNTSLLLDPRNENFYLLTGGGNTAFLTVQARLVSSATMPLAAGESAGGFSLAARSDGTNLVVVAVGGDYKAPGLRTGTAAYWIDGRWHASDTSPSGYRSAVAYDAPSKTWIAVGPNGTDFSSDDGRHWRAAKPATLQAPDTSKDWNALSLPFVAGPNGRIGKLTPDALKP